MLTTVILSFFIFVLFLEQGNYQVFESEDLTFVCQASDVPLKLVIGNCSTNVTDNILQWNINGTIIVHYDYVFGDLREFKQNSTLYKTIDTTEIRNGDKLNISSFLQMTPSLSSGTSIMCGSDFVSSNELIYTNG